MSEIDEVPVLDMARLTSAQQGVFELICCGQDGGHHPMTLAVLERMGLVVSYVQEISGPFPGTTMTARRWEVPLAVHIQWAEWCSNQPEVEDCDV